MFTTLEIARKDLDMAVSAKTISTERSNEIAGRLEIKARESRRFGQLFAMLATLIGFLLILVFLTPTFASVLGGHRTEGDTVDILISNSVLRIGGILLAVFLIQILVGFSRYYFRLSDHLSISADIIRLSDGDVGLIKQLSPVLLPSFDFGKMPTSPFQKIVDTSMETVRELAKKIPTK
jgi:hypothetical protein